MLNGSCIRLDAARSYDFYAGPNENHLVELRVPEGFELFTFAFSSSPTNDTEDPGEEP